MNALDKMDEADSRSLAQSRLHGILCEISDIESRLFVWAGLKRARSAENRMFRDRLIVQLRGLLARLEQHAAGERADMEDAA